MRLIRHQIDGLDQLVHNSVLKTLSGGQVPILGQEFFKNIGWNPRVFLTNSSGVLHKLFVILHLHLERRVCPANIH